MKLSDHVAHIKSELDRHWRCGSDTTELWRHVFNLEAEVAELEAREQNTAPATLTVTAHIEGVPMTQFPAGQPIPVHAAPANSAGVAVPDSVSWSATSGTITDVDPTTLNATLVNAAPGTVTITASDANGISGSVDVEVVDNTVATITVTAG